MYQHDPRRDLGDRYELGPPIGQGGMGMVCSARRLSDGLQVAVKQAHRIRAAQSHYVARFENEVDALERCRSPFVLDLIESGSVGGVPAYASELCSGTLLGLFRARRPEPLTSVAYVSEVLLALDRVHSAGFVHRDVKPSNVLIAPDGHVRLADFGIVRHPERRITKQGGRIGTPTYAAPDLDLDPSAAAPNHDLFSVGLLAFAALTGRSPRPVDSDFLEAMGGLPPEVAAVIARATSRDPSRRYQSAPEMVAHLQVASAAAWGTRSGTPPSDSGAGSARSHQPAQAAIGPIGD